MPTSKLRWGIALGGIALGVLALWWLAGAERGGRGTARTAEEHEPGRTLSALSEPSADPAFAGEPASGEESRSSPPSAEVGEAPPEAPSMRILVLDAYDHRPLAGARVTLFDRAVPRLETTDGDGRCRLSMLSMRDPVRLRVEAEGYCPGKLAGPPENSLIVELARAARLHGRVLAADTREPVAGASLALVGAEDTEERSVEGRSGIDGAYELGPVPILSPMTIEVRAEGFATTRRSFQPGGTQANLRQDIHLVRGLAVAGRVEDWDSGRALAGAQVGDLVCDAEGGFAGRVLPVVGTTRASLDIRAAGHASLRAGLDLAELDPTAPEPQVFRLPALAFLEGTVLSAAGPVSEALVALEVAGPARLADGTTSETSPLYELPTGWSYELEAEPTPSDAEGRYRLAVLPWSLNAVARAECNGFDSAEASIPRLGEPGSARRLDFRLEPALDTTLSGFVRLNGGFVQALRGTLSWQGPTRSGRERLVGVSYRVVVEPGDVRLAVSLDVLPGRVPAEFRVRLAAGETRTLHLDLEAPATTISGAVLFPDGRPAPDVEVQGICYLPTEDPRPMGIVQRARTDERGEYRLLTPDVGLPYDVGTGGYDGAWRELSPVVPGATGVDFELEDGHAVLVRVLEARTGAALAPGSGFELLVRGEGPRFLPLEPAPAGTDADGWTTYWMEDGRVTLLALPAAESLASLAPGRSVLEATRKPQRVELALEPSPELRLVLEGEPWPAQHLLWLVEDELSDSLQSFHRRGPLHLLDARHRVDFDAEGHAVLRGLMPGHLRFRVQPEGLVLDPESVTATGSGAAQDPPAPVSVRWRRAE